MEMVHDSGRLCDSGRVVIYWHISYPSGISSEADSYYKSSADEFEKSCRGELYRLASEYRRSGGRGVWRADFACDCQTIQPECEMRTNQNIPLRRDRSKDRHAKADAGKSYSGRNALSNDKPDDPNSLTDSHQNDSQTERCAADGNRQLEVGLSVRVTRGRECLVSRDFIETWQI